MLKSLLIKATLLAATAAVVAWVGWPIPQGPEEPAAPESAESEVPPVASARRALQLGRRAAPTLDLNRATVEELQTLPGVGEVLARRIAERRSVRGPFHSIEELQDVRGIGVKRLEQLRPLLTVARAIHSPRAGDPTAPPLHGAEGHEGP